MAVKPATKRSRNNSRKAGRDYDQLVLPSRWGRIASAFSLFMVPLAVCLVLLLSWAVDKELGHVFSNAKLRQQADYILLNLYEMGNTERAFAATGNQVHYQRFFAASQALDRVLHRIEPVAEAQATWQRWQGEVRQQVEQRRTMLTERILAHQQAAHAPSSALSIPGYDEAGLTSDRLTKLLADFMNEDEMNLSKRSHSLEQLRLSLRFAAIVAVISTLVLTFSVMNRSRRDLFRLRAYQSLLHSENATLEKRVQARTAELETARFHAEKERRRAELLLQDTSHRIGNSLATVASLLGLQLQRSHNSEVQAALASARDRIHTISAAHRRLRLGEDLETASVGEFLSAVVNDVQQGIPAGQRQRIEFRTHFEAWHLASRDVTTLGIILGELLTNAVKHAFPEGRHGWIDIRFGKLDGNTLQLVVEDNGIGHRDHDDSSDNPQGLGKVVIMQLCVQFGAKPRFENRKRSGTRVVIPMPALSGRRLKTPVKRKSATTGPKSRHITL